MSLTSFNSAPKLYLTRFVNGVLMPNGTRRMSRAITSGANDMTMIGFIRQKDGNSLENGAPVTRLSRLVMMQLSVYTDESSNMVCEIDLPSQTLSLEK